MTHFLVQKKLFLIFFGTSTIIFDVLEDIVGKIIESWHISIFPIIDKIIDFEKRLPQIIGNLKELSVKLSISISKIYSYKKNDLSHTPRWNHLKKTSCMLGLINLVNILTEIDQNCTIIFPSWVTISEMQPIFNENGTNMAVPTFFAWKSNLW